MYITMWKDQKLSRENASTKISRYRNEIYSSTEAVSFSEFISEKMKKKKMTRESLAIALGYEGREAKKKADILKHTIGREGYTTNRDRIIAICIALDMSHPDTSKALLLYGMLPLNEYDLRDKLLIQALTDHLGFYETNQILRDAKWNPLEIEKTKQQPGPRIMREPKEDFKHISGPTYSYGDFVGDCSLSGLHRPDSYAFDGEMTLQDDHGILYTIGTSDAGIYTVQREEADGTLIDIASYKSISECMGGKFGKYFLELEDGIRRKVRCVLSILDDTKNYIMRFHAEVKTSKLYLFVEAFNYDCPEYSEYYQMERVDGKYRMTVTHESIFLRRHLGKKYVYRPYKTDILAEYTSVEDIQNSRETDPSGGYWKEERVKYFIKLQDALTKLLSDLKNKQILINDPSYCLDDIYYDLAEFYKSQDLFTWTQSEENEFFITLPDKYICNATISDGTTVSITFDEMKRAFELGISDIDELASIKNQYGDIEGILK